MGCITNDSNSGNLDLYLSLMKLCTTWISFSISTLSALQSTMSWYAPSSTTPRVLPGPADASPSSSIFLASAASASST